MYHDRPVDDGYGRNVQLLKTTDQGRWNGMLGQNDVTFRYRCQRVCQ